MICFYDCILRAQSTTVRCLSSPRNSVNFFETRFFPDVRRLSTPIFSVACTTLCIYILFLISFNELFVLFFSMKVVSANATATASTTKVTNRLLTVNDVLTCVLRFPGVVVVVFFCYRLTKMTPPV